MHGLDELKKIKSLNDQKIEALKKVSELVLEGRRVLYFELPNAELSNEERQIAAHLESIQKILETRYWIGEMVK